MSVEIPSDVLPFVQAAVASGRFQTQDDVVGEALRLLREVEARRQQLRQDVLAGIASGESIPANEVFERLERRAAQIASGQ